MTTADTLRAARALIEQPERWTTTYLARNKQGRITGHASEDAVCWCAIGAIYKVTTDDPSPYLDVLRRITGNDLSGFNDSRTHAEVLDAFDRAIEIAEKS